MAGLINLRLLTDFFNKIDPLPPLRPLRRSEGLRLRRSEVRMLNS